MEQLKDVMKSVLGCLASQTANMESLNSSDFKDACDGIKDLAMAKYYCTITEAMEKPENVYGRDYDEHGKMYYHDRDMDKHMGKMYYAGDRGSEMMSESMYDKTKRYYTESKQMNPADRQTNMANLEKWLNTVKDELKAKASTMTVEEKQMAKNILNGISSSM